VNTITTTNEQKKEKTFCTIEIKKKKTFSIDQRRKDELNDKQHHRKNKD